LETTNGSKNGALTNGHRYAFDNFEIDPANRVLLRGGEFVPLTGKVFDTLLVFVENPNRLLGKDELMERVWPKEFVEQGNLARSVSTLRKALGDERKGHKYIVTVQSRGYRFVADIAKAGQDGAAKNGTTFQVSEINGSRERPSLLTSKSPQTWNRKYLFGGLAILLLLALISGVWVLARRRSEITAQNTPIDSIAVLPFENSTGDSKLDYLSEGITENIINAISPLPNLRVLPRSKVFSYKGKEQDPYSIGTSLGVRAILTGTVVQRNDTITIQTELIDIDKKAQIWGQQYVYQWSDIATIENNIALQVVGNLRVKLSVSQQQELTRRSTENPDAQKAYMWGLYYFNQALNDPTQKTVDLRVESIEYLQQATKLDPHYAQAYADLARSYQSLTNIGENNAKAKDAAQTALRLDETNPTAHSVLALILWQNDWDWAGADREFRRAIELSPNEAHAGYAQLLSAECRPEDAIREIKIAEELDPLNMQIKARMGFIYKDARQYDMAIDQFKSVLAMSPNLIDTRFGLIEAYALKGKYDEAEAESQNLLKLSDRSDTRLFVGAIYAYIGRRDEAVRIYEEYKKRPQTTNILMAAISTSLGNKDQAFFWLEKAYSVHGRFLLGLKSSPIFDGLHDDPRFTNLLQRIGLQAADVAR
jgi:DNA-binding winged helix-turn-helix (wHTH) protein/TolB-like protein/Tfp pilus assembly protein PilF